MQRHTVTWRGNDGAFSTVKRVDLPLNSPVTINVQVKTNAGDHSALLQLDVAATPGIDKMVLMAVNVARPIAAPSLSQSLTNTVARNQHKSLLVSVAPGTEALRVDLSGLAAGSQTRFIAFTPYGVPVESTGSLSCYANYLDGNGCNPFTRSYADPIPGVWEFTVESRRTSPQLFNPFSLRVQALGVAVSPNPDTIATATIGAPVQRSYTLSNSAAAITVTPQGGPLSSVRRGTPTIAHAGQQQYQVPVTPGARRSRAHRVPVRHRRRPRPVPLQLHHGELRPHRSVGVQHLRGAGRGEQPGGRDVGRPRRRVLRAVGDTTYEYYDGFTNASLGSLAVDSTPVALAAGASAPLDATVTAGAQPSAGRTLEGTLRLLSDGLLVGSGLVQILSVTN